MSKEHKSVLDDLLDEIDPLDAKKTENRMLLAARIDELVKAHGWNKSGFAERMRQQPSVISKWLSGTHNFTQDTLTEICHVLDVSLAELFREKPQELVFRSNFAVLGLAETLYPRMYYGGNPYLKPLIAPDANSEDWSEYIGKIDPNIGTLNVPHHGSQEWHTLGTSYWVGNINEFQTKNKKDSDEDRHYALKA
ncbi:helix-turn-helix domain-containing protein [Mucilaginibacter segetis]|uniref:Helix-turn-helix transcriptional regulator n=1 Tax=Mucilaginibacter segetis TaxID=2793071 RepID=A0A934UMV9_9SPHI|nr:helix-turn-helix transcriptional regulator [Mucilaginibacter segetis]MBK0379297.1 helix-turn-helix transcriptional regulator [Mucilaginibacter segetis]